ncbi:MAG: HAMP domain-containing sensor histidine kinase [Sphingomonas sp.]
MRNWVRSTTAKFLLLNFALIFICTLPGYVLVYFQADRLMLDSFARPLEFRRDNLSRHYAKGGLRELEKAVRTKAKHGLSDESALMLVAADGHRIAGNVSVWPAGLKAPADWTPVTLRRDEVGKDEPFIAFTTRLPSGEVLLLGGLVDGRVTMQRALLLALAAAFALALPIGLLGSALIIRRMNGMVEIIAIAGRHVADGNLSRRLATDGSSDPLNRLRESLNAMMARIEALVEELRLLTDALAHDIRSPLMRISAHVQLAMRRPRGSSDLAGYEAISREVAGLLQLLESALEISRAEAGIGREDFTCFDVGEVVEDLCEMYQPFAADRGVRIEYDPGSPVHLLGDRGLIARALANLVDNALKHGAGGRQIELSVASCADDVVLLVADRGKGIPADRRAEALQKFGRLDGARTDEGSGLGLALVNAVATLHGGDVVLQDNHPGLRTIMRLKRGTVPIPPDRVRDQGMREGSMPSAFMKL